MKTQRNILIAFLLNLFFAAVEMVGGYLTGSVAVYSDSVHDLGDALCIGVSYILERKSRKKPDKSDTYGYGRYSVLASAITTLVLLIGSVFVIFESVRRIIRPVPIDYARMIVFAVFGVAVNTAAAFATREGDSLNQKAVNLHMLEDVLGWIVVLIGAVVMRFTDLAVLDPILSIGVAVFILVHACRTFREALNVFMEKVPDNMDIDEIREHLLGIDGVTDIHHIHLWRLDENNIFVTMHVVTDGEPVLIKKAVRDELGEHGIFNATLELEVPGEDCAHPECDLRESSPAHHHHG